MIRFQGISFLANKSCPYRNIILNFFYLAGSCRKRHMTLKTIFVCESIFSKVAKLESQRPSYRQPRIVWTNSRVTAGELGWDIKRLFMGKSKNLSYKRTAIEVDLTAHCNILWNCDLFFQLSDTDIQNVSIYIR